MVQRTDENTPKKKEGKKMRRAFVGTRGGGKITAGRRREKRRISPI